MSYEWIFSDENINWEELSYLYKVAPLGNKPPERLKITFNNSMFKVFVYDNTKLIGAGRALADGADCSYICDIAILPEYQRTGVGKEIVQKLLDFSCEYQKVILYAAPGKELFYKKFGFRKMKTAMAIFKNLEFVIEKGYIEKD